MLYELKQKMKKFPHLLINIKIKQANNVLENSKVIAAISHARERLTPHGRVLVRASGTEPVIRVMVEGEESSLVETLAHEIASVIETTAV